MVIMPIATFSYKIACYGSICGEKNMQVLEEGFCHEGV